MTLPEGMTLPVNSLVAGSAISTRAVTGRRWPRTILIGLLFVIAAEALLFTDVHLSHRGAVRNATQLAELAPPAEGWLAHIARDVATNMTPIAWFGFLFMLEGILCLQRGRSPIRQRPHHFAMMFIASVVIWCVFDWVNFYFIHAWTYFGIPPLVQDKLPEYFIAFGTIVPGMLMTGQVLLNSRMFDWARGRPWRIPRWVPLVTSMAGLAMFVWPFTSRDPISNLTLWASLVFLLDPINLVLGRPSMLRDWSNGWYGRTLAAFAGGLICGLLWEFWNYWALAKWAYDLPFLGATRHYHYFEMPLLGLIGFIPFGLECWVMWQTTRIPLDGLVEPLPGDRDLL